MTPNPMLTLLVSFISGGLAGGIVSAISNRIFHWRAIRTKFYPKLEDIYAAYAIRMQKPEGRYWVTIVGQNPSSGDEDFVSHRTNFVADLVEFNELKEARVLRKAMLDNTMKAKHTPGVLTKLDLSPEAIALDSCLKIVHKKLKL